MHRESIWQRSTAIPARPELPGNISTDIAIVGGGLAGILTGDTNNIVPLVCLAAMAALIATLTALRERCRRRKDSSEAEEAKEDDLGEEGVPQET